MSGYLYNRALFRSNSKFGVLRIAARLTPHLTCQKDTMYIAKKHPVPAVM